MFSYLTGSGTQSSEGNTGSNPIDIDLTKRRRSSSSSSKKSPSSYQNIVLSPFPTKVFFDYNPEETDQTDGNLLFPMDDLDGAPVALSCKGAEPSASAAPVNESDSEDIVEGGFEACPMGAMEAYEEIKSLRATYHRVNKLKRVEERSWEGMISSYVKIWCEVRRRAKMGLNYLIFLVYNEANLENLEKVLRWDSFTVVRLPCKGDECERLYIAFDVVAPQTTRQASVNSSSYKSQSQSLPANFQEYHNAAAAMTKNFTTE
jgi:hypothetical protein